MLRNCDQMRVAGVLMTDFELGIPLSEVAAGLVAEVLVVATKATTGYSFDWQDPSSVNLVPDCP
jgi:hypothetical protein